MQAVDARRWQHDLDFARAALSKSSKDLLEAQHALWERDELIQELRHKLGNMQKDLDEEVAECRENFNNYMQAMVMVSNA